MLYENENFNHAVVFWCHAKNFDLTSDFKWRCCPCGSAVCLEWKLDLSFEVVVPAHCPFGFAIGIYNDFEKDSIFAFGLFSCACHGLASLMTNV